MKESSKVLKKEGIVRIIQLPLFVIDNFTDSIMINQAYSVNNKNPVYAYLAVVRNYNSKTEKIYSDKDAETYPLDDIYLKHTEILDKVVNESEDVTIGIEYARYWHGYLPILRVLLIFFNLNQLRVFNVIVLLILLIGFVYLMSKKFNGLIAGIFTVGLILEDYFFTAFSISGQMMYLITMIVSILFLAKPELVKKEYGVFIFFIGCITSFFDLFTFPLVTLTIPLLIYILYNESQNQKNKFFEIARLCLLWGIGYAMTWVSKWLIYDLIYHKDLIGNALGVSKYRVSQKFNITNPKEIFSYLFEWMPVYYFRTARIRYGTLISMIAIVVISLVKKKRLKLKGFFKDNKYIILISLLPIIWYIVFMEHSIEHCVKFTYREGVVSIIGILLLISRCFKDKDMEEKK